MEKNVKIWLSLEKFFWQRGLVDPLLRAVLCWQSLLLLVATVAGLLLFPWGGNWLLWFAFGTGISGWNFYALARHVQKRLQKGWSSGAFIRLFLFTNLRLIVSACLIFGAFARFKAPLSALLAGISMLLVGITVEGLKKALKNPA